METNNYVLHHIHDPPTRERKTKTPPTTLVVYLQGDSDAPTYLETVALAVLFFFERTRVY